MVFLIRPQSTGLSTVLSTLHSTGLSTVLSTLHYAVKFLPYMTQSMPFGPGVCPFNNLLSFQIKLHYLAVPLNSPLLNSMFHRFISSRP
jgi:hypothetical protein